MVDKVFIVWCKLNKNTDKFDLGIFIDKEKAVEAMDTAHCVGDKIWIDEYTLSKVYKDKH